MVASWFYCRSFNLCRSRGSSRSIQCRQGSPTLQERFQCRFLRNYRIIHSNTANCFDEARRIVPDNSYDYAISLCKGGKSMEPLDCYQRAIVDGLFRSDAPRKALFLCRGTRSADATLECYHTAYRQISNPTERAAHAMRLCGGAR